MLLSLANWLQTLSPEFGFFRVFQYLTFRAVMAALAPPLPADVTLLVKGSRFMRMERVVAALAGGIADGH